MAYEAVFGVAIIGVAGAALKVWRDTTRTRDEVARTREIANQTAVLLAAHQTDCNTKNVTIGRLDERVTAIQSSQVEIRKTVDHMDAKLDRLLEKS